MDAWTTFRQEVTATCNRALEQLGHEGDMPALEQPPEPAMGDLGMPCFQLSRTLRKAPLQIAEELASNMQASGWIVKIQAVGPYVNFWLDGKRLAGEVLADVDAALTAKPKPGRILLEHTSANPNGPLHVGRARNPILGDTLARILRAAGHEVETQYYMDDLGRQVALLWHGAEHIAEADLEPSARAKPDHELVRFYQAANARMKADPASAEEIKQLVAELETAPPELLAKVTAVYLRCFAGMQESLRRLGVEHDSIKNESDLVQAGDVEDVIAGLKKSPRAGQEPDGANYLDMAAELEGNKSTKFFFTRKDQTSVYATRDVAYHHWKAKQVGDGLLLNVLGEDHRLQSLQVSIALEELGHKRPEVVFYAFVSLPEGKMSTRVGRVVSLDDLLDEAVSMAREAVHARRGDELEDAELDAIAEAVGIAAVRYNIAKVQPEKPIKFRWEEALDFDGDSAPYLMYAYARACSLLDRAAAEEIAAGPGDIGEGEAALCKAISEMVPAVEDAAARRAPHRFAAYAGRLASAFNDYYRDHPILTAEPKMQGVRVQSVQAAALAMECTLRALGLPILKRM